ncbi:MAG TPA: hypothetical protein VGV15_04500, partial [Terriglobales bacterium]|nr:hypothetical protein [Terriglobales bacterium]
PLVLWSEGEDPSSPAIATGIAYPQAADASTSFGNPETYGFNLTQNNGGEIDASGNMLTTVGSTGMITGNIEDLISNDFNGGGAVPLNDTFTPQADGFGRIAGTFRNQSGTVGPDFDYYLVDDNRGFMIQTDLDTLSSGQVSLGYFAQQACDVTSAAGCAAAASQSSARAQRRPGSRSLRRNSNITVH